MFYEHRNIVNICYGQIEICFIVKIDSHFPLIPDMYLNGVNSHHSTLFFPKHTLPILGDWGNFIISRIKLSYVYFILYIYFSSRVYSSEAHNEAEIDAIDNQFVKRGHYILTYLSYYQTLQNHKVSRCLSLPLPNCLYILIRSDW